MLTEALVFLNGIFVSFLIPETLIYLTFKKEGNGWKYRFGGDGNLNPYISSAKVAFIVLIFSVVVYPILLHFFLWDVLTNLLAGIGFSLIFLLISMVSLTYLWILMIVIGKKWDKFHIGSCSFSIIFFILFVVSNFLL